VFDHLDDFKDSNTEWSLCLFSDGRVDWMNLSRDAFGCGGPRHMVGVPPEKPFALWERRAAGATDAIQSEPWRLGNSPNG
jgi:hypothetical protein